MVWKAWTDPRIVTRWWGPTVTAPTCEVDARRGGKINIVMLAGKELGPAAGQEWSLTGTLEEVTPQDNLVFTAIALQDRKGSRSLLETRTAVAFDDPQGKTELAVHLLITGYSDTPEIAWNRLH
jgi:uncharacterized protein YndB with AHSA1/START domain